jgi:hypothetical protein
MRHETLKVGDLTKAKNAFQGPKDAISPPIVNEVSTLTFAFSPTARIRIVAAQMPKRAASPFNLPLIGLT